MNNKPNSNGSSLDLLASNVVPESLKQEILSEDFLRLYKLPPLQLGGAMFQLDVGFSDKPHLESYRVEWSDVATKLHNIDIYARFTIQPGWHYVDLPYFVSHFREVPLPVSLNEKYFLYKLIWIKQQEDYTFTLEPAYVGFERGIDRAFQYDSYYEACQKLKKYDGVYNITSLDLNSLVELVGDLKVTRTIAREAECCKTGVRHFLEITGLTDSKSISYKSLVILCQNLAPEFTPYIRQIGRLLVTRDMGKLNR